MLETSFEYDGLIWTKNGDYWKRRGYGLFHRYLWKKYNGEIPKGWVVHHIDHNKENNDISNLQCMDGKEHMGLHQSKRCNFNINGNPKPFLGKHHTPESKKKLSKAHLGKMPQTIKPVKDLVTGKVFKSQKDAAEFFGVRNMTIHNWVLKKTKPRKNVNLVRI